MFGSDALERMAALMSPTPSQAVLGLTFNWGALIGWSAVHGSCEWSAVLPLYAGGFWWTLFYDTVYAHQDKRDDVRVGVGSTALRLGEESTRWLAGFGVASVGCLGACGMAVEQHPIFYAGLACGGAQLLWQVTTVNLNSRADCLRKFQSNTHFGAIVFAAIVAGRLLASARAEERTGQSSDVDSETDGHASCHAHLDGVPSDGDSDGLVSCKSSSLVLYA